MDTLDTKPIGIKEAMRRYGISSPSTWAEWLKTAGIQSFMIKRSRYIYQYQLSALDAIARERNRPINTSTAETIESVETEHLHPNVLEVKQDSETLRAIALISQIVQSRFEPISDPDENLLRLDRYAERGWRIASKDLAPLIGLENMPKSPYKKKGFLFEREGREWKVSKLKE